MIKRFVLLVVILILSLPTPALAAEPGTGTIEGQLVNGTENGSNVDNQEITLKINLNNSEESSATTKSDAEGKFVFNDLLTGPEYSYQITLTFQKADYTSDWLSFEEGEINRVAVVTVFDSTTSDEIIRIELSHSIVYVEPESLQVVEFYLFTNKSDKTYIGTKEINADGTRETLRFTLPDKASDLQPGSGLMECCIYSSEGGFIDTMPVFPGVREIVYSYMINHGSKEYEFSKKANYPMARYTLLVQGEYVGVDSEQLNVGEPVEIQGMLFSHLNSEEIAAEETLVVRLSNLPRDDSQRAIWWVLLTLLVLIAGFIAINRTRKRKLQPVSLEDGPDRKRQRLIVELAQLDDDFEGGKIAEEAYHRLRAAKKSQLVELIEKSKEKSDKE